MEADQPSVDLKKSELSDAYVGHIRELLSAFESEDNQKIEQVIAKLTTLRESSLYQELGMLTREIHDAISSFGKDDRVTELAMEDIPDAKQRLNFIVTKTNDAAHQTITVAEETMAVMDSFCSRANTMRDRWTEFSNCQLSKKQFIQLSEETRQFFESVAPEGTTISSKMTAIMLAQDYQDITGQMIKQVVSMVQEIEEKLVRLVAISATDGSVVVNKKHSDKKISGEIAQGPQLPDADNSAVASSQGDVDDLLASLGF